jgi:hypothetical protein
LKEYYVLNVTVGSKDIRKETHMDMMISLADAALENKSNGWKPGNFRMKTAAGHF